MKEQLYLLLRLQKIDVEISKEDNRKKKLPEQIRKKEEVIANLEKKYQKEKNDLKELQLRMRRKEIDAKTINDKIEKHQSELYGGKISDIKELKQLQKVIESLKKERDEIEEDLLILMDEEDICKLRVSKIEAELSESKEQLKQIQTQVEQQQIEIQKYIQKKQIEREELTNKITDRTLMERYLLLWNEKNGEAVVEIEDSICSGCNLSLPSDIIYHLQRDDRLIICPNCNRILVWKEIL